MTDLTPEQQRRNRIDMWRAEILDPDRDPLTPLAVLLDSFEKDVRASVEYSLRTLSVEPCTQALSDLMTEHRLLREDYDRLRLAWLSARRRAKAARETIEDMYHDAMDRWDR